MKRIRVAAACLLTAVFAVSGPAAAEKPPKPAFYERPAGELSLDIDDDTCRLTITEKDSGQKWHSDPDGLDEVEFPQMSTKNEMMSHLVVEYTNDSFARFFANSTVSSVNRGTFEIKEIDGGVEILYDFSRDKEQFKIPVRFTVTGGLFRGEVLFDKIDEYGGSKVLEVRFLPYFGASDGKNGGFIFVPDGSGAIIPLTEEKAWTDSYKNALYGADPALSSYTYAKNQQQVCLNVFGLQDGKNSLVGIVEKGDKYAFVEAIQPGRQSPYGSVAAGFTYRAMDDLKLTDREGRERAIPYIAPRTADENPVVTYLFLTKEDTGLVGMAGAYRDYLLAKGLKPAAKSDPAITVETLGATRKKATFLGLPTEKTVAVTTFDQLNELTSELRKNDVNNLNLVLYDFDKKGTGSTVPLAMRFDGATGGQRGYRRFIDEIADSNTSVYYAVDFVNIASTRFGWWKWNSTSTSVLKSAMYNYRFKHSTVSIDKKNPLSFFLAPHRIDRAAESFARTLRLGEQEGIMLSAMGNVLYTDYDKSNPSTRTETAAAYQNAADRIAQKTGNLALDGINTLMLDSGSLFTNVPVSTSEIGCIAQSVPFVSLALHGVVNLSGEPLNETGDRRQLLWHLLTGTGLTYRLTGADPVKLQDTALNDVFYSRYDLWLPDIKAGSGEFTQLHAKTGNQQIVAYESDGSLRYAEYEDGTAIAVNFGETDAPYKGHTVPGLGFVELSKEVKDATN